MMVNRKPQYRMLVYGFERNDHHMAGIQMKQGIMDFSHILNKCRCRVSGAISTAFKEFVGTTVTEKLVECHRIFN